MAGKKIKVYNIRNCTQDVFPESKFMSDGISPVVQFDEMPKEELQSVLSTIDDYDAGRGLLTE